MTVQSMPDPIKILANKTKETHKKNWMKLMLLRVSISCGKPQGKSNSNAPGNNYVIHHDNKYGDREHYVL